jgi:hypothetical protein
MPLLTIVTGLLEGDPNIVETANSVLPQLNGKASWLIKNSSSNPSALLSPYRELNHVKVICQQDSSLYSGLNQALTWIEGDFFLVLGAGDTLEPGAIDFIYQIVIQNPSLEGFYFAVRLARSGRTLTPKPSEINVRMACPHPGSVLNTQKVRSLGGFDERYQIASDYDLLCRYIKKHGTSGWSDQFIINYKGGGLSDQRALEGFLEEELIRLRVWNSPQIDVCTRGLHFLGWAETRFRELEYSIKK